jgi:hypothetical protein
MNAHATTKETTMTTDQEIKGHEQETINDMVDSVAALVSSDGSGDLGLIVRLALADDPTASAEDIADIVREARQEAAP